MAIGGMGKSALAWVWAKKDLLESSNAATLYGLDGLMWWSFYEGESSFAKFVDEALRYVSGRSIDTERLPTTYDRAEELRKQLLNKRVLFVLDGFERQLRDYASLDAAYKSDDLAKPSANARSCLEPITSRLLRDIGARVTRTKVLLTSRLAVSDLEDRAGNALAGVLERELKELSRDDAITFMRAQGVKKGTDAEIAQVCNSYGYHALSLRLLSGLIAHDARIPGEINAAPRHDVHDDLVQRQHHVLEQSYNALPKRERSLLSRIAAFRGSMTYPELTIFKDTYSNQYLEEALGDLRMRGLLQRDLENNRYDLHPIVRHYAYQQLIDKADVHDLLSNHFATFPIPSETEVRNIEDLRSTIELYYHTVHAGHYDEAVQLYVKSLGRPLYFRLGAYQTCVELLRPLFSDGDDVEPIIENYGFQAWVSNSLANAYGKSGQPRRALPFYKLATAIYQVSTLFGHPNINDSFTEAVARGALSLLLTYCGDFEEADSELRKVQIVVDGLGVRATNYVSVVRSYRGLLEWFRGRAQACHENAAESLELASEEGRSVYGGERDIILAEWVLSLALIMEMKDTKAAHYLGEALTRCRRINLVELEPNILLAWARWHSSKGNVAEAKSTADEALAIADRSEYRLVQAEIHNFLARLAFDEGDRQTAQTEVEIAKERAWCDGPPYCYKPALDEAEEMLKELGAAGQEKLTTIIT